METRLQAVETRSIEESLNHGHDAISRAENLLERILSDLNGEPLSDQACGPSPYGGVVSSADRLAGRIENICRDLSRARSKIVPEPAVAMAENAIFAKANSMGQTDRY